MRPCGLHLKVLVRPGCSTTNVPMPYATDCCESSWPTSRLSRFRFTCFKPGAGGCPQRQGFSSISRLSASGGSSHRFECAVFSRHERAQRRPKKAGRIRALLSPTWVSSASPTSVQGSDSVAAGGSQRRSRSDRYPLNTGRALLHQRDCLGCAGHRRELIISKGVPLLPHLFGPKGHTSGTCLVARQM